MGIWRTHSSLFLDSPNLMTFRCPLRVNISLPSHFHFVSFISARFLSYFSWASQAVIFHFRRFILILIRFLLNPCTPFQILLLNYGFN